MGLSQAQVRVLRRLRVDPVHGAVGERPATMEALLRYQLIEPGTLRLTRRGEEWADNFAEAEAKRYVWVHPRK